MCLRINSSSTTCMKQTYLQHYSTFLRKLIIIPLQINSLEVSGLTDYFVFLFCEILTNIVRPHFLESQLNYPAISVKSMIKFPIPHRGGSRGRVQGVRTPPPDLRFSNTTGILQKKKKELCGLLVLK